MVQDLHLLSSFALLLAYLQLAEVENEHEGRGWLLWVVTMWRYPQAALGTVRSAAWICMFLYL